MGLVQIVMIWGAASAALFPFPAPAGEWENFKDLKEALVRSSAKRDRPLPPWVASLDYQRPSHFYDLTPLKKTETRDDSPLPAPAPSSAVSPSLVGLGGNDTGNAKHD
jgi:hypothetical protein